jgi:hypothetical protein
MSSLFQSIHIFVCKKDNILKKNNNIISQKKIIVNYFYYIDIGIATPSQVKRTMTECIGWRGYGMM